MASAPTTTGQFLGEMMGTLAKAKLEPNTDLPFLINLETQILQYMRPPTPSTENPSGGPAPIPMGQPGMPGMPPPMGQPQMGPPMMGGGQQLAPMMTPSTSGALPAIPPGAADELQRMLTQTAH